MFGRESKSQTRVDILIGSTARINGDVDFEGGLHVDGRIDGNVRAYGSAVSTLSVGEHGVIEGNVEATNAVLNGTVRGDIRVTDKVVLGATARVIGTVYYTVIESAAGAEINGMLVQSASAVAATAPRQPDALSLPSPASASAA